MRVTRQTKRYPYGSAQYMQQQASDIRVSVCDILTVYSGTHFYLLLFLWFNCCFGTADILPESRLIIVFLFSASSSPNRCARSLLLPFLFPLHFPFLTGVSSNQTCVNFNFFLFFCSFRGGAIHLLQAPSCWLQSSHLVLVVLYSSFPPTHPPCAVCTYPRSWGWAEVHLL